MDSGTIFDIKRYAINDGPGIRTAVFFKGCPLRCWWCHNPEGQVKTPQLMYRANRCKTTGACLSACPQGAIRLDGISVTDWALCDQCGKCAVVCYAGAREMVGRSVSSRELRDEIRRDVPFYDQSGGGVTMTGGEPMYQLKFLKEILQRCTEQGIRTAVDTSGATSWENFAVILPLVDLFLYDVKVMDDTRHKRYTSVSNRRILDNLQQLAEAEAHIIVRIPLVPGCNDDEQNLEACALFLARLPTLEGVQVMPYHDIGRAKYEALGMEYKLDEIQPASAEQVQTVEEYFSSYNLPVIGNRGGTNDH